MNIEATIIVMVYKNLDQVRQTLDSIKKQTYSNYEVIVSDDGSPNYTQEDFDKITEQYKNEFTYFKLINNGINRGTVKHFNSLIKQAKGTIICPLSSGDQFYNENSLQEIMNAFDQEDKLIYTSKRMIKKENSIEYYPSLYQVSLLDQSNHFFEYIMKYGNFVSGASTYYKKEIFDKYGLFDEKYKLLEDYPFYVNLAFNNEKIGYIDYPTIQYELGGISTASNRNPLLDQDYVTLFKDVLSQKDIHLSHMTKRALNYRIDKITKKYNSFLVQLLYIDVVIMLCLNKAGIIKGEMGKIMSKLKKQFISNIPYYVLFFILLFIHIQLNVSTGDDVNFAIRAKSMTFTDFNIYKYYNWSSRQLIESVLYFISVHSHVWMLLNSLVITIIAKLIEAIFCNHTIKMKILCCIGTLIYPLIDMSSAGWMATTINYYWPLGALLINLYYLKKANNLIKLKWYEYIISSIALLFAANQEQGFAILLGTYFFYIINKILIYCRNISSNIRNTLYK